MSEEEKKNVLVTRRKWSTTIKKELYADLEKLKKVSRRSMTSLLDEAIEDLLEKYKKG